MAEHPSIEDLERGVRVPVEDQVTEHDTSTPTELLDPEDVDRIQLLANPSSAGRLRPRSR